MKAVSYIQQSIKQLDLFSIPFFFNIFNNENKRKTIFGGAVSLIVICISIIYFSYLCYLYFQNQINPTISQISQYYDQNYSIQLQNNILAFQIILPSGKTLQQLEQETGLQYLNVLPFYVAQGQKKQLLSFIQCKDSSINNFLCLDFSSVSNSQSILDFNYDKDTQAKYKIELQFILCNNQFLLPTQKCATYQQIRQEVIKIETQAIMIIQTQKYDPSKKRFEINKKSEIFGFSEGNSIFTQVKLQKGSTTINQGFVLQYESRSEYLSDYTIFLQYIPSTFVQQEINLDLIGSVQIFLSDVGMSQQVQFPPFTSLLAQFSSVFNVLVVIGIICQFWAQNELVQDFVEVQLKSYFKHTAFHFIQSQNTQKFRIKDSSFVKHLTQLYNQIQGIQYQQYADKYSKLGFFNRVKLLIFSRFNQKIKKQDNKEIKIFKALYSETQKQMSILELQKELMQIKIILRLLISAEQYAAIKLCGYSVFIEKNSDEQIEKIQQPQKDFDKQQEQQEQILSIINYDNMNIQECQDVKQLQQKDQSQDKNSQRFDIDLSPKEVLNNLDENKTFKGQSGIINNGLSAQKSQMRSHNHKSQICEFKDFTSEKDKNFQITNLLHSSICDNTNHLDIIDQIDKDSNIFEQYLQIFFDKRNKGSHSDFEERIFRCMIGVNQNMKQVDKENKNYNKTNSRAN
ncbi:transmembrane protein, putative (macronuclear) [Tetrahymena thermophila SB210]|uniref:Transmembrane protein, putative n=1 Tax=Tetrahymena thermophila (strain SB210) TaxID=312017 RepID=I7MIX8_TETTS|nr:transmembrane protein, putative [Tetrahymena thermophila SB210]EAR95643.3 transmembrane protein, putative [Tetrahymena thermophila SB210]|eukprot:XP_001015888.3 transmembrane protein, putative [Tetrahymena thermophila SB210]